MNDDLPSITALRVFDAAARHLSYTEAARELHVSQTAVSHQMRRLERDLGVHLFVRQGRGLALSASGRDYAAATTAAFAELRAATRRLKARRGDTAVVVTTTPSFAAKWLVPRLAGFQQSHREVDVRIATGMKLLDLAGGEADVSIRFGHGDWPGLAATRLFGEDLFPVCAPALASGSPGLHHGGDLAHQTLLHTTVSLDDWPLWLTAAGIEGIDPSHGLTFDTWQTTIQAAIDGLGVAVARASLVESDLAAGRLVAPCAVRLPIEAAHYVVTPPLASLRPSVAAFRRWIVDLVAQLPAGAT